MIILRKYQTDIIDECRALFSKKIKNVLMVLPTGAGKTALTASMIHSAAKKNMSSLFIVHRRELILQSMKAFDKQGMDFGVISPGFPEELHKPVQIASIQTLSRRLARLKHNPNLVIFDETHHVAAKNWTHIYRHFLNSYKIGLTATPCRLDGQGLNGYYDAMIQGPSMAWLIENKFLSDYKLFAPNNLDLSGVHTKMGDYVNKEIADLVDQPKFTGNAINEYKKHALGKRAVVFCVNVEHSKHVAQEFNLAGITAEHIDGSDDSSFRSGALERFASGETKILCNCDLFGEGFNLESIEVAILLRPTKSLSLYLQQVGRALRPSENKTHAIIIDHVRNWEFHGLPDEDRAWSLEGAPKRDKQECPVKLCPQCYAALKIQVSVCPECNHIFQKTSKEFDPLSATSDHALGEVDKQKIKNRKIDLERARAVSKDDLVALAVKRGYKNPHKWAHLLFQSRQAKKLARKK